MGVLKNSGVAHSDYEELWRQTLEVNQGGRVLTKMAKEARARDKSLLEFVGACTDLEEELDHTPQSVRKIKIKIDLVKSSYEECLEAQTMLMAVEKTSAVDDKNKSWVNINLRIPKNLVLNKAEEVLERLEVRADPEVEENNRVQVKKRSLKTELTCFETELESRAEAARDAFADTLIWAVENYEALMSEVTLLEDSLRKGYSIVCNKYLDLLEEEDVETEIERQAGFRKKVEPIVSKLKASLLSKKPSNRTATANAPGGAATGPAVVQQITQVAGKEKFKMAAMAIPKFSGKIIDYVEWKKIFRECVETRYEESAVVLVLKTEALPESLRTMVPRCTSLEAVWEKLDKKFLDPNRVWKGVKADLSSLDRKKLGDRKYITALEAKLLDAESLLESVGMVHWLRQEDKIPEYEDFLTKTEKLEWIRSKPAMRGTPWENFKQFLNKAKEEYEELSKTGTADLVEEETKNQNKCKFCKRIGHVESECRTKKIADGKKSGDKKECFICGSEDHLARACDRNNGQRINRIKEKDLKKRLEVAEDCHSNYLRTSDCKWCGRMYNSAFSCSGCGQKWAAKTKAEHCLAHCEKFNAASPEEKGNMVTKGKNCLICLHHEHDTASCFGKEKEKSICGLGGCKKKHHPALHSSPQTSIQAVQVGIHTSSLDSDHLVVGPVERSEEKGEEVNERGEERSPGNTVPGVNGPQHNFLAKVRQKSLLPQKVSWTRSNWVGGTAVVVEELRAKELEEMKELLKLPPIEGNNVLLLMQSATAKYGLSGDSTKITIFWDEGSTCSLIQTEKAEQLLCPSEPIRVSIETVNGEIVRDTKLYCVELLNHKGERVLIRAFGVENISEVRSIVDVTNVKEKFSVEVQSQWGKISKRPRGTVHLLLGSEYAGYHPMQYEAQGNLVVCRSMFGQGWMLMGHDQGIHAEECCWGAEVAALRSNRITVVSQSNHRISVNTNPIKVTFNQDVDFYTMENLGVEPPKRCTKCKGCRDCGWRAQNISRQEALELDYIEGCVELKDKRFKIKYPFLVDPCELADNYGQVVNIAETEEKRLIRDGKLQEFNDLFRKLQELGALEEISETELKSWTGPVHYVSLQHVIDEGNATTSLRIVTNSSLKTPGNPHSLNSILAKGPNVIADVYKILLRFRTYLKGLSSDITKAYYQMFTGLIEKHVRRVVWRYGVKEDAWKIFGYLVVSFGDVPAATLLNVCLQKTICMHATIDLLAARRLENDIYVDDIQSGGENDEVARFKGEENPETLRCSGTMPQILKQANFELKAIAITGEDDGGALKKLSGEVFGMGYSTQEDMLTVQFSVNISPRRRKKPTEPDLSVETLHLLDKKVLTRRLALGIVNGQFDPLGIASPFLINLKTSMRDLFISELGLDWDSPLPNELNDKWSLFIKELVTVGGLKFRRCIRPEGEIESFWLVIFWDGSDQAYAVVIYCRWKMADGQVIVQLLCAKARVAPLLRINTPRIELNGGVAATRLGLTVVQALEHEMKPDRVLIGGDSETVLAAREKGGGAMGEYFGNRVGEIWELQSRIEEICPVGIDGSGKWYHMPSRFNCADKPTRLGTSLEDIGPGSEWQEGMAYLKEPFESWPWERNFAERKLTDLVPKDEIIAKFRKGQSINCREENLFSGLVSNNMEEGWVLQILNKSELENNMFLAKFDDGFCTNDFEKLIDLTEPYFRWLAKVKAKKKPDKLTLTSRELAVKFWFKISMPATQEALKKGKLKELCIREEDDLLVLRSRVSLSINQLFGNQSLPVIMSSERIAVLIMQKCHEESDHKSVDITFSTSRQYCWVVGGRRLAKLICKYCVRCRYLKKKEEEQMIALLPKEIGDPCPPFTNVGIDLAGPYQVVSMVKKKATRGSSGTLKVWALLVMCLNTRALKVYLVAGYSTEDFLLAWNEFESECGLPRLVHSDRGSQLVSASDVVEYNWDVISEKSKGQTKWQFCPSGSQWRNGAIESFVKRFKRSLELYKGIKMNFVEMQSAFKRIAAILNSRPISARFGPKHTESDPDYLEMITPNMLLTGRSGINLPSREYSDEKSPLKRLIYKEELELTWWNKWKVQCFDSLIPSKKWQEEKRNMKVGDVVLIKYESKSKAGVYRLGIIEEVEVDEDGLVRSCVVGYRLVRSDMPKEDLRFYYKGLKVKRIRVGVQRLCLILPFEEREEPEVFKKPLSIGNAVKDDGQVTGLCEKKLISNGSVKDSKFLEGQGMELNARNKKDFEVRRMKRSYCLFCEYASIKPEVQEGTRGCSTRQ